jgi:hypothetical protein
VTVTKLSDRAPGLSSKGVRSRPGGGGRCRRAGAGGRRNAGVGNILAFRECPKKLRVVHLVASIQPSPVRSFSRITTHASSHLLPLPRRTHHRSFAWLLSGLYQSSKVAGQSGEYVSGRGGSHGLIVTSGSVKWMLVGSLKPASRNNPTVSVGGNIATPTNQQLEKLPLCGAINPASSLSSCIVFLLRFGARWCALTRPPRASWPITHPMHQLRLCVACGPVLSPWRCEPNVNICEQGRAAPCCILLRFGHECPPKFVCTVATAGPLLATLALFTFADFLLTLANPC